VVQTFFGLVAPAGTPAPIVARINAAINQGMQAPDKQQLVADISSKTKPNTPAEFAEFIAANYQKWVGVGQTAHIKVD
jgi:tripartite-type tricarboxylate transporter receptor subunit TctC